jgi:hypothetical protein
VPWVIAIALLLILAGAGPAFAIKPGAVLSNRPEVQYMRRIVADVMSSYGYETMVTSGLDSQHMADSKHYQGLAEDYRTHHINRADLEPIRRAIATKLGADYDFLLEDLNTDNEHFHGEFDPA